jgi:FkbM family methyltransferase
LNEDHPFRHYKLKHRLIALISMYLFDRATYKVRHGMLKGMRRKGGLGWVPELFCPNGETPEYSFWRDLNLSGMTVYDIGAFHGLLTLYFASRARRVVCFEPNSNNRKRLLENLALNGIQNAEVRNVGVGSRRERLTMRSDPLMPGGASVDRTIRVPTAEKRVVEEVSIVALDEEIANGSLPTPDFIKIDIEGWEMEALRGARHTLEHHKPTLFLEMHGESLREKKHKVAEIAAFLWEIRYRNIRHIETGTMITPKNTAIAAEGHLYCSPLLV